MKEATLMQILDNREARVRRQEEILAAFGVPLLSFTMNIAGPVKVSPLIQRGFREGLRQLDCQIPAEVILHREEKVEVTGCEALFAVRMDAGELKGICEKIEENGPLGRLFDLDVVDENGQKLSRKVERCCLICGKPGRGCAARRVHRVEELQSKTYQILQDHFAEADALEIGRIVRESLLEEVAATPKPGLVDRNNTGSHRDMNLDTFEKSAAALEGYFAQCVRIGQETAALSPEETFARLRPEGVAAEEAMYRATGGVNTHKGAIYSLGVLCGSFGRLWTPEGVPIPLSALLEGCSALTLPASRGEFARMEGSTAGEKWYLTRGITGIRGEVSGGFLSVREIALPRFSEAKIKGFRREMCGIYALLHLIAAIDDTTLLHRGGEDGAAWAKEAVRNLLDSAHFPTRADMEALDNAFIERNLSPGGAADLLAVTFFLTTLMDNGFLQEM